MTPSKWIALAAFAVLMAAFFYFDAGQWLTLARIKSEQAYLTRLVADYPVQFTAGFALLYVVATAVSLPGAALILTLTAGALFGLLWGVVIVSFASTTGATLAMLIARWLFRDQIERRFSKQFKVINKGIEAEGAFYLFTMRLIPAIPFFAINLAMALTRISVPVYFAVSQLGMLAGTIVYVNAGTELAQIESPAGILSPGLIASFVLLGVFPILARWFVSKVRAQRVYRGHVRPGSFDRDMVVIGAGAGGLVAALIGTTVKARVTLIEKHKMGGDCLNTGCVPSKALIRSARFAFDIRRGAALGFADREPDVDFPAIMARIQRVIRRIEPHDSVERYESLGVDVEQGHAEIVSPWQVRVNGRMLTTRNIIVATGAGPLVPPIKGIDQVACLTSDNLWALQALPARTLVLGGGPIGCELAQALARLGSTVTIVEQLSRILPKEDEEFSAIVLAQLEQEGVTVLTGHRAEAFLADGRRCCGRRC